MVELHDLDLLPADWHGWFHPSCREGLRRLIAQHRPKIIVELGSWLGVSGAFMASVSDAQIYCVDTWQGDAGVCADLEGQKRLPHAYQQFLSNMVHAGLRDRVTPVRMTTVEAAAALDVWPDLIYLDAAHDEASVRADLEAWAPYVMPGGVICGDDAAVVGAVVRSTLPGLRYFQDEAFWWLE